MIETTAERSSRRQHWFDLGVHALGCVRTPRPTDYLCPLCLDLFSVDDLRASQLTDEHVPPRSVGGEVLVLTCRRCNETSGSHFDEAMADEEKLRTFGKPFVVGALPAFATIDGTRLSGKLRFDGTKFEMIGNDGQNNPRVVEAHTARLEQGANLGLSFRTRGTTRLSKLGWVRSAYLAAFAMWGYRYVLEPAFDVLRTALKDPTNASFEPVVVGAPSIDGPLAPMVAEVVGPDSMAGFRAALFGPRFVPLPPWGAPADWFVTLRSRVPSETVDVRLQWLDNMRFPQSPMHFCDG